MIDEMHWLNEPVWGSDGSRIWVTTLPDTDFWQRTHYGFQRDTAHAYLQPVQGDFKIRARFRFEPNSQYDQCGLILRIDKDCWLKCSVEFENEESSRLGSVVTNHGYSDWATQDIPSSLREMSYEMEVRGADVIVRFSYEHEFFHQMRIAHLDTGGRVVQAGFYGCSPIGQGFRFEVFDLEVVQL